MWPWVLLILFIGMVVLFGGCMAIVGGAAKSISDAATTTHAVTYQAESSGRKITILYDTSTAGGISNASTSGVASSWSKDVEHAGLLGPSMTVSLDPDFTRAKQRANTVTCRILYAGKVVKEASSEGEFASASCMVTPQELNSMTGK